MNRGLARAADAAGLLLIRGAGDKAEVLMGRRHSAARFMPGVYVFPGGRTEPADARPSGFNEALTPLPDGIDLATRRRLATFARTALRETFEETGLLVADPRGSGPGRAGSKTDAAAEVWWAYDRAGLAPAFPALALVARAITPAVSPMRFHTRFFRADGRAARGVLKGDGELEHLHWVPVGETDRLPMSEVTALVLREALAHGGPRRRPAALFRWTGAAQRPRHAVAADAGRT